VKNKMSHDIFLRAHTALSDEKEKRPAKQIAAPKWPDQVLIFDTETTIDTWQDLTFGAYRLCRLVGERYLCYEEGLLHADGLDVPGVFGTE
jgi:hypothetical protein